MPKLSSLGRPKPLTVKLESAEAEVQVVYNPGAVTPDWQDRFQGLGAKATNKDTLPLLQEVLISWDITDDDGRELAPTEENMRHVPAVVLYEIVGAIFEDMTPKKLRSATSAAGSQQKG